LRNGGAVSGEEDGAETADLADAVEAGVERVSGEG
jgi:hypothetical protein